MEQLLGDDGSGMVEKSADLIAQERAGRAFPVSWDQFHRDCRALTWRLNEVGPFHAVIAITRGGLVPAAIVARELGIRTIDTVCIASYDHTKQGDLTVLKGVSEEVAKLGGPANWALPYWNYFKRNQNALPRAFASQTWPDGGANPLFVAQRYGPNGDGKTTTSNMLCTLVKPTGGSARVAGHDVTRERDDVRRNIGLVFQEPTLDG